MKKLIIIRGNAGSGKTTVAEYLQKKFGRNTMLISQDMIRLKILWTKDGENTLALPLMIDILKYGHKNCDIVILEGILKASWYKKLFETGKELYGEKMYVYYYDLEFEETLKRHLGRAKSKEFGEKELRSWWNEKDYLNKYDEKIITKEYSLEETIEMISKDIDF